ncbi:DUF1028 domain-containing protein [Natronomonas sp. CBA1123]|jgi:uncharacterized Ntn-hydrolase superfamily protein|uniref:DUF1028 domain-containing protein n=1 Tax=Natronomonas sp. CBA1123 TaxID=2668070 RepID=UPI0012E9AC22|nr:DUF1028 domain-containing protein [Natronomonas sp. CBA1123]MUV86892.1 DUF1028 domain-containing protein [Natronomonas sp. CBA1123]
MTFSICVHEEYEDDDGTEQHRFGVAVTTRLAGVGTLCPFASENGAVATQSLVNVELGEKGIEYIDDGLAVEDALQSLLNADDGAENRQLHGVDREGSFVFSGEECKPWFGHHDGGSASSASGASSDVSDGGAYTVAGNLLTGEAVIDAVADSYDNSDREEPLAKRLIDALEAGHAEGGDKREDLPVQSAALLVETTEERAIDPAYENLRVDATETPLEDLKATYETAVRGHEDAMERYEEAYEDDDL